MKLNHNSRERTAGYALCALWFLIILFYCTWDGWMWEWHFAGYQGANQHFDLNVFELHVERGPEGALRYVATSNVHNIIYICFGAVFFMGWVGLLTGARWARQGAMATMGFSFVATLVTLNPRDHLYLTQIVFDTVHIVGISIGLYLFYRDTPTLRAAIPGVLLTWGLYLLARIVYEPWPYWSEVRNASFGVNQINDMPFYLFGLEYIIVVALIFGMHVTVIAVRRKLPGPRARVLTPLIVYGATCGVLKAAGLIEPPYLPPGVFAS